MKKVLSLLLCVIMTVSLFAGMNIQVGAATIKLTGSTSKDTAPTIALDTEYATYYEPDQVLWFKFTAKKADTWYTLWGKNTSVETYWATEMTLAVVDEFDEVESACGISNTGTSYVKLENGNTYYIRITSCRAESAGYIKFNLKSEADVYPETIDEAAAVSVGKKYTTTLGAQGDVDYVKFSSGKMTAVNLSVHSYDIDCHSWSTPGFHVNLYNANKELMWGSGKIAPDTTMSNDLTLEKGKTYYLAFYSDYNTFGKYNFTISCIHKGTGRKVKVTPATMTANGKIASVCTVCGKTVSTSKLYKVSHIAFAKAAVAYTGKPVTPSVIVKNCNNVALKKGTDYTVTYPNARTNIGTYKATVKLKGNYAGTKTLTFKIVPKNPTVTLMAGKGKATVAYKKVAGGSIKYEIQYSTKKASGFTSVKKDTTALKATKTGLKKGATYYFRVRAYKKVEKTTYYSGWTTKSVKIN